MKMFKCFALLCCACSATPAPLPTHFDLAIEGCSVPWQQAVERSAEAWSVVSDGLITFDYVATGTPVRCVGGGVAGPDHDLAGVYTGTVIELYALEMCDAPHSDCTGFEPAELRRIEASWRQQIATHELGHLLGLGHTPTTPAVMYYAVGGSTPGGCIAQADLDLLCEAYSCKYALPTCD